MQDATDPPTLAYAAPGFTPPAGTAFTVFDRADGVRIERPLPGDPFERFLLVAAAVLATALAVAVLAQVAAGRHAKEAFELTVLAVVVPGGFVAYVALILPRTWPRTQVLDLAGDQLTVVNGDGGLPGTERRIDVIGEFGHTLPVPDVARMRLAANLYAGTAFGAGQTLVRRLPLDECRWLATALRTAYERSRPPPLADADRVEPETEDGP